MATLPAAVSVLTLMPKGEIAWGGVVGVVVSCGIAVPLANVARDAGRRLEARLRKDRGGRSSATMLRHSDARINGPTKKRYHAALRRLGVNIPTRSQESAKPDAAEAIYESAIDLLLARRSRETKGNLEFKENVTYGYRRNTLGLKPISVAIAAIALVVGVVGAIVGRNIYASVVVGLAALLALAFNLLVVNSAWVLASDDDYARQLLRTLETDNGSSHL